MSGCSRRTSSLVGQMVACEFVVEQGFDPESVKHQINQECRERLAAHERPRFLDAVATIRLSDAGKKTRRGGLTNIALFPTRTMSQPDAPAERRHVIISGGSRGLGQPLVEGLLPSGYRVSTFSRNRTEFVDQLAGQPDFFYDQADVGDPSSLHRFLEAAKQRFGPPYGLVNCAGVAVVGRAGHYAPRIRSIGRSPRTSADR